MNTKCVIDYCDERVESADASAPVCAACFARIPDGAQYAILAAKRGAPHRSAEAAAILAQAVRRLIAENRGRHPEVGAPWVSELPEADELTRTFTAFASFKDLVEAFGSYFPKLDVGMKNKADSARATRLADFYDREQAAKGDPRRAVRLGFAGL